MYMYLYIIISQAVISQGIGIWDCATNDRSCKLKSWEWVTTSGVKTIFFTTDYRFAETGFYL